MSFEQQLVSDDFLKAKDEYQNDFVTIWKRKYKYSSNDPRFYTATMEQILTDILEDKLENFISLENENPEFIRVKTGEILDPEFYAKENESFKEALNNIEIVKLDD